METKWRGTIIVRGPSTFQSWATGHLNSIYQTRIGRKVIGELEKLWSSGIITYDKGKFGYNGKGEILCDPLYKAAEPTRFDVVKKGKEFIYLYHELAHLYRDKKGTYIKQASGATMAMQVNLTEEFTTVGLYEHKDDFAYSENALRAEIGVLRRPSYMTPKTVGDKAYTNWRDELLRRMILRVPDPFQFCKAEVQHVNNTHNRKLTRLEIALARLDFDEFRKKHPFGWHPDKISGGYPLGKCGLAGKLPNGKCNKGPSR